MAMALLVGAGAAFADDENLHEGWPDEYRTINGLTFHRNFTDEDPTGSTVTLVAAKKGNGEYYGMVNDYGQSFSPYFAPPGGGDGFRQVGPEAYTADSYIIPAVVDGMPVVKMNYDAFQGNKVLRSITFPEANLIEIPTGAFSECTALESLNFGGTSIKEIRTDAFAGCTALREIVDWGSVEVVGNSYNNTGVFRNCTSLTALAIGPSVRTLSGCVFNGCSSLSTVAFADTDQELLFASAIESQFSGCPITTLYIGRPFADNVLDGWYRFKSPFIGLTTIENVTLGPGIKTIRNAMFAAWKSTGMVHAPEVTTIADHAFCQSNMAVDAPKLKILGESAFDKYKLTSLNLYEVEEIGVNALAGSQLVFDELTLTPKARRISEGGLGDCPIERLIIADSDEPIELGYAPTYHLSDIGTEWEYKLYNGLWGAKNVKDLYVGRPLAHEDLLSKADEDGHTSVLNNYAHR